MTPVYKLSANSVKNGRTVYGSMLAGNTAYVVPTAFESIATVTVGSGGAANVEFTSIAANWTHLQVRILARTNYANTNDGIKVNFNSDTGNNYSWHQLGGNGSITFAQAGSSTNTTYIAYIAANNAGSSRFGASVIDILDYGNTNKYKTLRNLTGYDDNGNGALTLGSGLWQSNNAITSIKFTQWDGTNFAQYSSFALYGIKAA